MGFISSGPFVVEQSLPSPHSWHLHVNKREQLLVTDRMSAFLFAFDEIDCNNLSVMDGPSFEGEGEFMTRNLLTILIAIQLPLRSFAAEPSPDPFSGTYYQEITAPATWDEARVQANSLSFYGVRGHLITVSNSREAKIAKDLGGPAERWIGLTDSNSISSLDGLDFSEMGTREAGNTSRLPLPDVGQAPSTGHRGSGFVWITGEALEYQNWAADAPSDFLNRADAVHTNIQGEWMDATAGETLDQPGLSGPLRRGYIVEYETTLSSDRLQLVESRPAVSLVNGRVPNLDIANKLLDLPAGDDRIARKSNGEILTVSLYDPELGGGFADYVRAPFLTDEPNINDQHFAFRINGQIEIPTAGDWTFAYLSGNAVQLTIFDNYFEGKATPNIGPAEVTHRDQGELTTLPGGAGNVFHFPRPGIYELELTSFDSGFWSYIQLFAAQGEHTEFDAGEFRLVGDILNGGLLVRDVGDFDGDGKLSLTDLNELADAILDDAEVDEELDLNGDGLLNRADQVFWIRELKHTWVGDTDLDGYFDSNDMISVFQTGLYETDQPADWQDGDWNGNNRFETRDLIFAFQHGGYESGRYGTRSNAVANVPEPNYCFVLASIVMVGLTKSSRRRNK